MEDRPVRLQALLPQYREMVQAESGVEWESDGIIMTEDRYCQEMLKPERGGISIATSKV